MIPISALQRFLETNDLVQSQFAPVTADDPWSSSAFRWLLKLPSRRRGAAGEALVREWLRRLGYPVERPTSSGHDLRVASRRVEVKLSTLWANGSYAFQQLRDQDYEYVLLVGISPPVPHAWLIPKAVAWSQAKPQHAGQAGADTKWLRIEAGSPPTWMSAYGGTLDDVERVLTGILGIPGP